MWRPILLAAITLGLTSPAAGVALIPFDLETTTASFVKIDPLVDIANSDPHDSSAIADVLGIHAQSAGRSRLNAPQTIAANGSFVAPGFLEFDVETTGQATQKLELAAPGGQLSMHFVLPSLLLEFSDNVERLGAGGLPVGGDMFTQLQATICVRNVGGPQSCLFELVARLDGHFGAETLSVNATTSDPALDLGAFENQAPSIVADFFKRTATWEFGTFEGDLDLSAFTGGVIEVNYEMVAFADGRAAITTAAASINDPFLFTTDPTLAAPITFDFIAGQPSAVPAPGGLPLLAVALGAVVAARRLTPPPRPSDRCGPQSRG
jgi:hypothetical protein